MQPYSPKQKHILQEKMLPPYNTSVSFLAEITGISPTTLYRWRKEALVAMLSQLQQEIRYLERKIT
ncbi:transposase [Xenorhabdus sp. PR6a]|uniref:transposase n=1 Tax=Xenorhabdus sp. PR6a TaxID=3025877 RepID=UPI0023583771|nr:transposase [Xenorhabdus sp. PR6a]MDC9582828.1 transposase [Xenorhabdus sp. PR6a]